MWDFFIIILCNKYFCVFVNIVRYKNGICERGFFELKNWLFFFDRYMYLIRKIICMNNNFLKYIIFLVLIKLGFLMLIIRF